MSRKIRLGFLTHSEGKGTTSRIYQETLELFVAADQLGFDVGWLAEHHFREVGGRLPSLFPFLAVAGERTKQIRLGAAVALLPYTHPLRVAEDAAVVDTLTNGRVELGVGSGMDIAEFEAFGVDYSQRHAKTTESLTKLQQALRGEPLGDKGQVLQPAAPTLVDRIWQSAQSLIGAEYVAKNRVGLVLARMAAGSEEPTDVNQLPVAQKFAEHWPNEGRPRIAVSRGIYPAADKASALKGMSEGVMRIANNMAKRGVVPAGLPIEEYCKRMHIAYGHPDEVAEFLLADRVLPYATDLILQFNPATPPVDEAIQMFEQIATKIAPAIGWQPHTQVQTESQLANAQL